MSKYFFSIIILGVFLTSCNTANQLRYFRDIPDSAVVQLPPIEQEPRIIQKLDRLNITFGARSPEAAAVFNNYGGEATSGTTGGSARTSAATNTDLGGYLVNEDGVITFPIIGEVQVSGLTTKQLIEKLILLVGPYLKEPLVNARFLNFKFTVLGEVRAPGTYTLSEQRTTLLDALGVAGDLPRSAKRYGIQLYRDYNGVRKVSTIDLRKSSLLNDPELFQVKHNDVIIVQPRDVRLFSEEARGYVGLLTLLVGAVSIIISLSK